MKKNENNMRDLWDNIKLCNIQVIGVPEGEDIKNSQKMYLKK